MDKYFKQHCKIIDENDKRHSDIEQWIQYYGSKLVENMFGPINCKFHEIFRDIYGKSRLESFEIIGDIFFQSLHWELMRLPPIGKQRRAAAPRQHLAASLHIFLTFLFLFLFMNCDATA